MTEGLPVWEQREGEQRSRIRIAALVLELQLAERLQNGERDHVLAENVHCVQRTLAKVGREPKADDPISLAEHRRRLVVAIAAVEGSDEDMEAIA